MCLDLVPEPSFGLVVQMFVEMSWGGAAVGGRSERSTKIRKIRHIGCLLLACVLSLLCFLGQLGFDFRNSFFARS